MLIGRVERALVATLKQDAFHGTKLLVVRPLDLEGRPAGADVLAVDAVGAGVGEVVLVCCEGKSARQVLGKEGTAPIEAVIVGIVDHVTVPGYAVRDPVPHQP